MTEDILDDVKQQSELSEKVIQHGWVYMETRKGTYGFPQVGLLVQEVLETRLAAYAYTQNKLTSGLWSLQMRPTQFCFVVDNFRVKNEEEEHAEHLKGILEQHYKVSMDWKRLKYIGLIIKWDYNMQ